MSDLDKIGGVRYHPNRIEDLFLEEGLGGHLCALRHLYPFTMCEYLTGDYNFEQYHAGHTQTSTVCYMCKQRYKNRGNKNG